MRRRRFVNRLIILGIVVIFLALFFAVRSLRSAERAFPVLSEQAIGLDYTMSESPGSPTRPPTYVQSQRSAGYRALKAAQGIAVTIKAADYAGLSADTETAVRRDETKQDDVVDWLNAQGWIEWNVEVPQDGLYEFVIDYLPLAGTYSPIVRGIQIDGAFPFQEADRIQLERWWKDGKFPYDRNPLGNEIRPVQTEIPGWRSIHAANYETSSEPLLWPLAKGRHTIRMTGGREPVSLASIQLSAPQPIPDYAAYSSGMSASSDEAWYSIIEAERYAAKSAIGIQTQSTAEPFVSPDPQGRIVYNSIGGDRWQTSGDWIEWEFAIPKDGLYTLDLKYFQGYNGRATAYRTLMIDGEVPFREMLHYPLPANNALDIRTIADRDGKPYLFRLSAGAHRLRLVADASPVQPAVVALRSMMDQLSVLERDIRVISGNYGFGSSMNLDTERTWNVSEYDPEFAGKLGRISEGMKRVRDYLDGLNQRVTDPTTALSFAADRLDKLIEDVDGIPNKVSEFADIQASINTWLKPLQSQPVLLDLIVVRTGDADPGLKLPNVWDRVRYTAVNFARSFVQKYDLKDVNDKEALTVWVQRGRDYVDLLRNMIEQDFTPKTGIRVNVNLMPAANVLLLGNAAGDRPDAALGVGMDMPVDYAMRGAAADLSEFPGFVEVEKRFYPGVMRSYFYNGGTFGLPETQTFMAMFYRTDIFERLGLTPPDTWDDVLKIVPTLQENGMMFYYPAKEFVLPFYQHGAEFYSADGLRTTIDDATSTDAFKQWTELFTKYDLPKDVPLFFNHFRFGDMPIGIADFNTYLQLNVAAPDIEGKWKMVPLPGIKQANGEVDRWSGQVTQAAMVMAKSQKKEQAWAFLDWWTSAETQGQFARDIESFAGIEYRWNTANTKAMQLLPWPYEDIQVLTGQGRWARNVPYVPGSYFLSREMDFAWNNKVIGGMPAYEALDKAAASLQREMNRKQKEFGLMPNPNTGEKGGVQP